MRAQVKAERAVQGGRDVRVGGGAGSGEGGAGGAGRGGETCEWAVVRAQVKAERVVRGGVRREGRW